MAAQEELFNFIQDGKHVSVYRGEGTSYVFYRINRGSSHSTGLRYSADTGRFTRESGALMSWDEAKTYVRGLL